MSQTYEEEFKKKIVRLHLEEGRTLKSITDEFGVAKSTVSKWCNEFTKECQQQAQSNPDSKTDLDLMQENRRLRKELEEAKKENLFLKKAAAFFTMKISLLRSKSIKSGIPNAPPEIFMNCWCADTAHEGLRRKSVRGLPVY